VNLDSTITCWGAACSNVEAPPGSFTAVGADGSWICGVKTDGTLACWNQCLLGAIPTPPSGTFTSVSVGVGFACGVRTDGTLACWGNNSSGELRRRQAPSHPSARATNMPPG
jgi:hypothetical protein